MRIFLLLFLSAPAHAGDFLNHVKESIVINQERRSVYRELTLGRSEKVLRKLIYHERELIPFAYYYDIRAQYFRNRGVSFGKDEFVSMISVPDFDPEAREIPEADFSEIPWKKYKNELDRLIDKRDRVTLMTRSLKIIKEMSSQPAYWCLTRHLIESIYRFAWFLPERVKTARKKGVRSPEKLIWDMMDFHNIGFGRFANVDRMAVPIQKEGIPILCAELPDLLSDLGDPLSNE